MKSSFFKIRPTSHALQLFFCFLLLSSSNYLLGQCSSCTYTISSNNSSYYNLSSGQRLCITSTGNFTGQLNLQAGAFICNQGTLSPTSFNIGAGTLDNYGTINFNPLFNVNSGATVNNYGTINANGNFELNQSSVFNNLGGTLTIGGSCRFDDNSTYTQTSGSFTANSTVALNNNSLISFSGGTVTMGGNLRLNSHSCRLNLDVLTTVGNNIILNSGYLSINNQCSLIVSGNYTQSGARVHVNHYLEVNGNFTRWSGNVTGPTSGCGKIAVSGNSTNSGLFGTAGNIDFCDAGNPSNGWDNNWGSMGAGITFCTCSPTTNQNSQWLGLNNNWHDATNWSTGSVPSSSTNVTIPNNLSYYPIINANAETGDLTVESAANMTISNTYELSVYGDFDGNGWTQSTGTIVFEGAASQSISGINHFYNLSIDNNNNVVANDDLYIAGLLNCENGNLDVNSNIVTLQSGAVFMDVSGGVTGNLTVERTIPSPNGYHYITAPVSGQTMAEVNDDFTLVGLGGTLSSNPFPNIWYYDETNPSTDYEDGWTTPANLSHSMGVAQGYAFNVDAGTTIDFTGVPHTGTITKSLNYTSSGSTNTSNPPDGWELIGNPYLAPIDWELAQRTNVDNGIYFWSPDILQYASYADGVTINGGGQYISSFQAFFVRANAASASVVFDDNMKVADPNINSGFKNPNNAADSLLRLKLVGPSGIDECVVRYAMNATNGFDNRMEAYKINSNNSDVPSIASKAGSLSLSINALPLIIFRDTIPLFFKSGTAGMHSFHLDSSSLFLNDVNVFLKDAQTNIIHSIEQSDYSFSSVANQQSNRFSLIVERIITSTSETPEETQDLKLFYNNNNLIVSSSEIIPLAQVKIYNAMGQVQFQSNEIELSSTPQMISTQSLHTGLYVVSVFSEMKLIESKWIRIP